MTEFNINENLHGILKGIDCDCVIIDKVFASCQQRECFPEVEVTLGEGTTFNRVRFRPGFILPNTLIVTDTNTPNYRRVRFTIRVPYQVLDSSGNIIAEGFLPDIFKDIVIFIPDARDEFDFRIVVETSSEIIGIPVQTECVLNFTAGVFIIVKVVGAVQLLIPAFGYCPPPPQCDEFSPTDVCDMFENADFPDFFPCQMNDEECLENTILKKKS